MDSRAVFTACHVVFTAVIACHVVFTAVIESLELSPASPEPCPLLPHTAISVGTHHISHIQLYW